MARVTVEDCITKIPNRFELVITAAQRSRQISAGSALAIERDNDKNPIAALREIAADAINLEDLKQAVVNTYRQHPDAEPQEEEFLALLAQEREGLKTRRVIIPDSGAPTGSSDPFAESVEGVGDIHQDLTSFQNFPEESIANEEDQDVLESVEDEEDKDRD